MKRTPEPKTPSLANIAPRQGHSLDASGNSDPSARSHTISRPRLPPRSRFGCWTCRTRKVKCDEARPECTPCARLGHACDYNPRLSFKDDTPRVVNKISGRGGGVGPVWISPDSPVKRQQSATEESTLTSRRRQLNANEDDTLPPFQSLTNDEDREQKARFQPPGTYHVVVNPDSFVNFNEYKETFPADPLPPVISTYGGPPANRTDPARKSRQPSPLRSYNSFESSEESRLDTNVVILNMFEDNDGTSLTTSPAFGHGRLSRSNTVSNTSASVTTGPSTGISAGLGAQRGDIFRFSVDNTPLLKYAHPDGRDHSIIYYYKNFVHRHLAQVHRDTLGTSLETGALTAPDVLERQAGTFLPLYHALMAFSALSMSHKHGMPSLEALQHYQQALPLLQASLHNEEDLASDGVFLTHFILLLYEIAAGEVRSFSYWQQHITQLLRITLLRRKIYGTEPYNFVVWWVANIDTHVVLSGMGSGEFIESMLRNDLLPSGLGSDLHHSPSNRLPANNEMAPLPSSLSFHRRICVVIAQLSILARDIREEARKLLPHQPNQDTIAQWHRRIEALRDTLRRTWNAQMSEHIAQRPDSHQLLPVNARGIFEHSYALYRALLIYSYTSMYPSQTQHNHAPTSTIPEVIQAGREILDLAREIVQSGHMERKFIVFPLFIAGCVNDSAVERQEIVELLKKLEDDSIGRNFRATRQLLETVYERKSQQQQQQQRNVHRSRGLGSGWDRDDDVVSAGRRRRSPHEVDTAAAAGEDSDWLDDWGFGAAHETAGSDVDWVGMIRELGLQVVNCRL